MFKSKSDTCSFSETVRKIVEPLCQMEQIEFVHAERVSDRGRIVIRIYLDKTGGITIADCILMNRHLGDLLDVHLENPGPYHLEISSPGPNRPLTKMEDFERFKGKRVSIETAELVNGRKKYKGFIDGIENGNILLLTIDQQTVKIEYDKISKARLSATHGE
ncbi:MAG: ribosome maturation factor RimP [Desulfamplus sp.]|nr:ribosome maturation factor RimP [Desulfamplus sp.]MBF0258281.1 ribosome maturation factor RimP [Desulfamplus sp.]